MTETALENNQRLIGLDFARFLAFFGMVVVNFTVAMGAAEGTEQWANWVGTAFEGRAAATFVILAGLGLGLATQSGSSFSAPSVIMKRALFLLVLGLLNVTVFVGDILHYYALYFAAGAFCLQFSKGQLLAAVAAFILGFLFLLGVFNYDAGWNWETLNYSGFWTVEGFTRNLFFNGWHPFTPWFGFFLFGLFLAKLRLGEKAVWLKMILWGSIVAAAAQGLSQYLLSMPLPAEAQELASLLTTKPIPPGPLYMVAAIGTSMAVIGLCLLTGNALKSSRVFSWFATAGRQTLTLYLAHIFIGMGVLDVFGLIDSPGAVVTTTTSVTASILFTVVAVIYANIWSHFFKAGPVEWLMRKLAG